MSPTPTKLLPSIHMVNILRKYGLPAGIEGEDKILVLSKDTENVRKIIQEARKKMNKISGRQLKIYFIT